MLYTTYNIKNHSVIKFEGEIDLYNCGEFKKTVINSLDELQSSIIIDLKDVEVIDSSAISALISCKRKAELNNLKFGIVNIPENFYDILKLATLNEFFTIYPNYDSIPA
jgi:anti-sigma B factor antagonist